MTRSITDKRQLKLLSIVIPARNEQESISSAIKSLHAELLRNNVPHEIVVVDDGSTDSTWELLQEYAERLPELKPLRNSGPNGFGRAVIAGLDRMNGDAAVIMMADQSDDPADVMRYWYELKQGYDCVFGSRFSKGGSVHNYPPLKLILNRMTNNFLSLLFGIRLNDTTNAFKAYRREVIDGCRPLISPHFNLTVELPLKAIVRGFSWTVIPISWHNRRSGAAKFKIKEMGSRYLYVWLEKYFSCGDYRKR
jgi:dolichol-phosphate mannosyltransferase